MRETSGCVARAIPLCYGRNVSVTEWNRELEHATPEGILAWAWERFRPDVMLTCSFQHDGVVLAHMLHAIAPEAPIVFINTGFHFPETLAYRDEIVRRLGLRLVELEPIMPRPEFAARYGLDLYARNPDLCCHINKVEPLKRYLPSVRAWVNGRRRDQASTRAAIPIVEELQQGALYKVNPLASWTSKDTFYYLERHGIPTHPLDEPAVHEPDAALPGGTREQPVTGAVERLMLRAESAGEGGSRRRGQQRVAVARDDERGDAGDGGRRRSRPHHLAQHARALRGEARDDGAAERRRELAAQRRRRADARRRHRPREQELQEGPRPEREGTGRGAARHERGQEHHGGGPGARRGGEGDQASQVVAEQHGRGGQRRRMRRHGGRSLRDARIERPHVEQVALPAPVRQVAREGAPDVRPRPEAGNAEERRRVARALGADDVGAQHGRAFGAPTKKALRDSKGLSVGPANGPILA